MDLHTVADDVELVICEAGSSIRDRIRHGVPAARIALHTDALGDWLQPTPVAAARRLNVIDMQALPAAELGMAAGAATDQPTIWVAGPPETAGPDAWPARALHVLPHDFTVPEFCRLAERLLQELDAAAVPVEPAGEDSLITYSAPMQAVLAEADLFADCDHNVLVLGETGTGKERLAERLHRGHPRYGRGPFVPVNCGAIPDGLFESHFFGHARGAFTGAPHAHKGYFEQAHGGTLFLDEVGDLPLLQQVKLLRVLETGCVTRLGTETATRVDFRLVAATHRPLRERIAAGEFRADLYYRLAVVELRLPTLEERGVVDKIAIFKAMAQRVLGPEAHRALGEPPFWLADAVAEMAFPGNVRQLRNLAERVGVIARQTGRWDRPLIERALASVRGHEAPTAQAAGLPVRRNWDAHERRLLVEALATNGWKRQETARALGISRKALWEKMRKYQIVEGEPADA